MLRDNDVVATAAVKDLQVARKFYEGTLGLKLAETEGDEVLVFRSGSSKIFVYRSQFAGTNRATNMTWTVESGFDQIVRDLKGKGVKFEHYQMPGLTLNGDVHVGGDMQVVWFKDPDGNILSVVTG